MAFVDELTIYAQAGAGGPGVVRWLHMKGKEKGGPSGGDGGRGGDVVLEGVRDLGALATYRFIKKFRAENGEAGGGNLRHGRDGEPVVIKVPVGTVATNTTTGEAFEIMSEGQQVIMFRGGQGGYGNHRFKSSTNQNPFESTGGRAGQSGSIRISLKLIADAGFIGFPNAGKSSLLNELTRARSKVGAYPFTTLDPYLGEFYGYVLADIPGLIEGASGGKGLGSKFLKHIERTKLLVHLVSAEHDDPAASYKTIRRELETFGRGLSDKPELVVLSKTDTVPEDVCAAHRAALTKASGAAVHELTLLDDASIKAFSNALAEALRALG